MNVAYPARKLPSAPLLLLGIIGLHCLLLPLLQFAPRLQLPKPLDQEKNSPPLVLWLLPKPATPVAKPLTNTAAPVPIHVPRVSAAVPAAKPAARIPPAQVPASPPPAPLPAAASAAPAITPERTPAATLPPGSQTGTLSSDTKRDLARIAQEMRQESRFPADFNVHAKPDKLALGIADAYRGDGPTTFTDIKLPDGRVMTKVSGPGGTYCVYKDSVGHSGGVDQMQRGVMTKVTNCPK